MKDKHFFNTADENSQKEIEFENKAKDQEKKILIFLQKHRVHNFTSYYIINNVFSNNVPMSSVVRAISKLRDQGYIIDTGERVQGPKGRKIKNWKLVSLAPTSEAKKTLRQKLKGIDKFDIHEMFKSKYQKKGEELEEEALDHFMNGAQAVIAFLKN